MNETGKRALLYGGAFVLVGGLVTAMLSVRGAADIGTLLSSVDVQLRMAYVLPERDKTGQVVTSRRDMIADAEQKLAEVERRQPGIACAAEFRGFAQMMRGQLLDAAGSYAAARACGDCTPEQRDVLAFNEARMLAQAGQGERALAVFAANAKALDQRFGSQRAIEEAGILRQLGRTEPAVQRLLPIVADDAAEPMAWLQAGQELQRLGRPADAARAFERARASVPIADYELAQLKLAQGEVDKAMELLERAAAAVPVEVRKRIREEAATWQAVAEDARFQELSAPRAAAPGR